jgi:hypothetical protein
MLVSAIIGGHAKSPKITEIGNGRLFMHARKAAEQIS